MKRLSYVVVCGLSFWCATIQAVKPAAKKTLSTKKLAAPKGSTKGASKIGMMSSDTAAALPSGGLNVNSGTLPPASGASSSPSTVGNYTVHPEDNAPPFLYKSSQQEDMSLSRFMYELGTQGYTTLVGPCRADVVDTKLDKVKAGNFGIYRNNKFFPASKSTSTALNKPQKCYAQNLTQGVYKINQSTLREAIKEGKFAAQLLTNRLLVQEFFLGRLAVTMQAMSNGTALGEGQADFKKISDAVAISLKQTRYIRNGVEVLSGENASVINVTTGKTFTPVDFFVGAIVVNKSDVGIKFGNSAVIGGGVGFLPVPKAAYMNNWTNSTKASRTGLPTREPMTLGELGSSIGGPIALTPSQDKKTMTIQFSGRTYTSESFGNNSMESFLKDFSPWAVIIEVPSEGSPTIIGLAKMSPGDYGQYLNLDGSIASVGKEFTLGDVINAPYNLYRRTYQKSKTGSGKRFVSGNAYPVSDWVAQGMFNGQLELSTHQTLAYPKTIKSGKKKIVSYPLFKSTGVALTEKHSPNPEVPQILAENSGIDWLFLRALRITKAVLVLSGITEKLLNALDEKNKHTFLHVLQDPTQDRIVQASGQFHQSANGGAGAATQVSGSSMLSGFSDSKVVRRSEKVAARTSKKSKVPTETKKTKKAKSPILKGDVLYIGSTANYLPIILTTAYSGNSDSQQSSSISTQGLRNVSSMTPVQAYKKGYREGQKPSQTSHSFGASHSSRTHDATFHSSNASTILPTSQASQKTTRKSDSKKGSGSTSQTSHSNSLDSGSRNGSSRGRSSNGKRNRQRNNDSRN